MLAKQANDWIEAMRLRDSQRRLPLKIQQPQIRVAVGYQPACEIDVALPHGVMQRGRHPGLGAVIDQPGDKIAIAAQRRMGEQRNTVRTGGGEL